jgi:glycosyltransferase involved in cell wall biosynthesis
VKLLVTVTLSPNQVRSHLLPILTIPEVEEVVLVADTPPPPLPKLSAVIPSAFEKRVLGRAGSKLMHCGRLARQLRPDWIVSYNIMPHGVNGYVAGRLSGCRTIYHMIGGELEWRGGGWASDNAILGRLPRPVELVENTLLAVMRRTDIVCTMGSHDRTLLVDKGLDPGRIFVTPPSVDCDRFSPASPDGPRRYDLVTVAAFIPRKRLHDFLEIVAHLRAERPHFRAAIAGTGPLETELKHEAKRRGVGDAIDFLGPRTDVENVYRSARVFILTSRHEALSVAMTEAMACGLPPVVTDVGDVRDLVQNGKNGLLVSVGEIGEFVSAVNGLLSDEPRYKATAEAARSSVVERQGVKQLSRVYRKLLVGADDGDRDAFEAPPFADGDLS